MKKIIVLSLIVFTYFGAFSQSLTCCINVDRFGEPDYTTSFMCRVDYDNAQDYDRPVDRDFTVETNQSGGYITVTHEALTLLSDGPRPQYKVWLGPGAITVRFEKNDTGRLNFDFKWYRMRIYPEAVHALQEAN